jgi:AcrR family transcriptional regulator
VASQPERSAATRAHLIAVATGLFAEHGFDAVSAQQIVGAAGLTRGAMYHHFADKRDLFRAVFEQLEDEITAEIAERTDDTLDPTYRVTLVLDQFLDICARPTVRQIALSDAPAVLGWVEWRAIEARHGLAVVIDGLQRIADQGRLVAAPDAVPDALPVAVLAQLVLSAVIEAALMIAHADDPVAARAETTGALLALLRGIVVTSPS